MSNTKHLNLKDFEKSEIIEQVYAPSLMKGRGKEKLIGELDKAGKNVKTANGWVPVKGNEHLVTGGHISDTGTTRWSLKDFKVDSLIHFNDGEVWQVVKESTLHTHDRKKDDGIKIKPYNELAKKRNTSLQINVDLEYLNKNATKVVSAAETKTEVSVHPDIQSELDNYKGGTIPSEVLIHLATKYASKQPTEVFHNVHGAQIRVYGKEGNNYAINFGGAKGITLATEADMDALRGIKKQSLKEKVIQILGDISANNRREKRLIQENIDKVYDNFDKKEDYAAALRLIYDFEANDRGKSVKREALNNIASEIENHIKKQEVKNSESDFKKIFGESEAYFDKDKNAILIWSGSLHTHPYRETNDSRKSMAWLLGKLKESNIDVNKYDITTWDYNTGTDSGGTNIGRYFVLKEKIQQVKAEKPTLQLSGTDGNVFSIIGKVSGALKRAGQADNAKEFTERAFKAGSYDEVLQMVHQYVNAK